MCTVATLFIGYQMLLIVIIGNEVLIEEFPLLCKILGFVIQFFFLSAFCWMSAMSAEVWLTFRKMTGSFHHNSRLRIQRKRFLFLSLYSWGVPFVVFITTVALEFLPNDLKTTLITPQFGKESCFFNDYEAQILYFHGIIALILIVNLIFFLASSYELLFGIWAPSEATNSEFKQKKRPMFWIILELFLVMGLTWMADVASMMINWKKGKGYFGYEIYLFDIINSLQGFLIFLVLICKPRIRKLIVEAIPCCSVSSSNSNENGEASLLTTSESDSSWSLHRCFRYPSIFYKIIEICTPTWKR